MAQHLVNKPIVAGLAIINIEALRLPPDVKSGFTPFAGVRVINTSEGGGYEHYTPPSDVYLRVTATDAQALSELFSTLAMSLRGVQQ